MELNEVSRHQHCPKVIGWDSSCFDTRSAKLLLRRQIICIDTFQKMSVIVILSVLSRVARNKLIFLCELGEILNQIEYGSGCVDLIDSQALTYHYVPI